MFELCRQRTVACDGRPPVVEHLHVGPPDINHRLDGEEHARLELGAGARAPGMDDLGAVMEQPADPMTAEVANDAVALRFRMVLNGVGDVSKVVARLGLLDPEHQAFVGDVDQLACPEGHIAHARPGARLGDIGAAIQAHAESQRYGVVRDFCGHGVGRLFHDSPEVIHAGRPGTGPELKPGMFFTVEPMINIGRPDVKLLDDGWTAVTRDRSLSAQFEHSIGITEEGCEIFTKSPKGLDKPPYA